MSTISLTGSHNMNGSRVVRAKRVSFAEKIRKRQKCVNAKKYEKPANKGNARKFCAKAWRVAEVFQIH